MKWLLSIAAHTGRRLWSAFCIAVLLAGPGCQTPQSQSPAIAPTKDVRLTFPKEGDVHIHGDLIIHYHQTTTVELGGGNKSDQTTTQDIAPTVDIPIGGL